MAQKVGSKTGQRLDWQGGGSRSEQRDRDFSAQEEGPGSEQKDRYFNLGIGRKEKYFFVRKEGDLDSRQRDVFGPNDVLGTRRREELSTKAVESLQPFRSSMPSVMPDSVSSHPHHENEPLSSQLENLAPSKEEEETGDRTQERRIRRNPTRADPLIPPLELKIAVKKRVQNTNNEMMANQIWRLTGEVLLSRDKFFITFYRGKDFVPQSVASTLTERELIARDLQEEEEKARNERNIRVKRPSSIQSSVDVIRSEIPDVKPSWVHTMDIQEQERLKREVAKLHQLTVARQLEKRLDRALKKKEKAEQALRKIETFMTPLEAPADVEMITEEERFMYRRLGMKMKSTLVLG